MIKNFHTYNEGLRDQMTPKNFPDDIKDVLNKFDQLTEIDVRFTKVDKRDNFYFVVSYYFNIEINYDTDNNKWIIFTGTGKDPKADRIETDDFNVVLKHTVNKCFPNIDSYISDIKDDIKDKENFLKKLEKFKKLAEYDN